MMKAQPNACFHTKDEENDNNILYKKREDNDTNLNMFCKRFLM